jgi:DNA-binding NarL/FixJ family response regulator
MDMAVCLAIRNGDIRGPNSRGFRLHLLTDIEVRIGCLLPLGLNNEEIAKRIHVSVGTVKDHLKHIYREYGVRNRVHLAAFMEKKYGVLP